MQSSVLLDDFTPREEDPGRQVNTAGCRPFRPSYTLSISASQEAMNSPGTSSLAGRGPNLLERPIVERFHSANAKKYAKWLVD